MPTCCNFMTGTPDNFLVKWASHQCLGVEGNETNFWPTLSNMFKTKPLYKQIGKHDFTLPWHTFFDLYDRRCPFHTVNMNMFQVGGSREYMWCSKKMFWVNACLWSCSENITVATSNSKSHSWRVPTTEDHSRKRLQKLRWQGPVEIFLCGLKFGQPWKIQLIPALNST